MPRRFGLTLRELLRDREEFLTSSGNLNLRLVAGKMRTYHYESLRKAAAGERAPTLPLIEATAKAIGVSPDEFYEYGLLKAREQFDPDVVGVENALENLARWVGAQGDEQKNGKGARERVAAPRRPRAAQ